MCKVSVLVPIYNVEEYLGKCLSSLEKQDLRDLEIICINDGSTDESLAIARKFEKNDTRFRVVNKENSGYGKTMNLGLSLAKGKYIGIVESDDFVEANMFSTLLEIAEQHQADVVKSSFWTYSNGHDSYEASLIESMYDKVLGPDDVKRIYYRNPSIWSNLYRRTFIDDNNIKFLESPGASFQDIAWRVKVFTSAERIVFTDRAFYHYRRDNANASVKTDGKLFCVCDEYDEVERFLEKKSAWDSKYKYLLPYLRWGHYVWNCFDRNLNIASSWIFFKRMYEEFLGYDNDGLLKRSFWTEYPWRDMQNMLWNHRQFFFDRCVIYWRKFIIMKGFLPILKTAGKIAVYGAGKVGREALVGLCLCGIRPDCFVVSSMSDNESYVDEIPVRIIDELLPEQSDYVILIAVGMASQPEILELLLEKGFYNVVGFLPEFRQALR